MNYPIWEVPAAGLLIAGIAILHVFISHFAVGGGLFLVVAERKARRDGDAAMLEWVRGLSRFFILLTLVLGAVTGVGIWFTIGLIHPPATSSLINTFVWGWAIEWTFFVAEIAAAMVYYYGWDRLSPKLHMAVGWIYFANAWLSLVIINGILSYMLTPGRWLQTRGFWDGFFNPTYWPMVVTRTFGAAGIAGLYALFAISFSKDPVLKQKVATWTGLAWVIPALVIVPAGLLWTLRAAASAGVPVAELFGAKGTGVGALLGAAFSAPATSGYRVLQHAGRGLVTALAVTALLTLWILLVRRRSFRPVEGTLLLVFGILAMGGAEWVREGLRKPFIIGHYMFVNGVRLPAPPGIPQPPAGLEAAAKDRFSLDALSERGVLTASLWASPPAGFRPATGADPSLPPAEKLAVEAAAGREVFKLLCATCHTIDGYQGIRKLVRGKTPEGLEGTIARLAVPVTRDGKPSAWTDPQAVPAMWRSRGMPPFAGTVAEKRALAVYLAQLGGAPDAALAAWLQAEPLEDAAEGVGAKVFEGQCSPCHGADAQWPIGSAAQGAHRRAALRADREPAEGEREHAELRGHGGRAAGPFALPRRAGSPERGKGGGTMNAPTIAYPDPMPLPAPGWLLWFLLMLTFFLHLLPMNILLGGSIISAVTRRRGLVGDRPHHRELTQWFAKAMPVVMAATITFGIAPLLFVQVLYGRLFFASAVLMGWFWLAVIPLLIIGYYGTYLVAFRGEGLGALRGPVGWGAALIFMAIGFIYSNNMSLMLRPDRFLEKHRASAGGFNLNLDDPTQIPRYLHILLGAIAVAGLWVALLGLIKKAKNPAFGAWATRYGALWFAIPTAINLLVGFFFLFMLPSATMGRFLGGSIFATAVFAVALLAALGALMMALLAVQSPAPASLLRGSVACAALTLVGMILIRDQVRRGALAAASFEPVSWVAPQWAVIGLFAVLLVAALGTVGWMILILARGRSAAA